MITLVQVATSERQAVAEDDVHGYLVVNAIIAILIGLQLPAVQKEPPAWVNVRATTGGSIRP